MNKLVLLLLFSVSLTEAAGKNEKLNCAACQFFAIGAAKSPVSITHCQKFGECKEKLEECQIARIILDGISLTEANGLGVKRFESSIPLFKAAVEKCAANPKALVISESPSKSTCMLCWLVYDVLKYINYNILSNPMLGEVKGAIEFACSFLNEDLCEALFEPDAFSAIIRGLKDSLGGFYDVIAVQGFNCPDYTKLFGECPN